MPSIVLKHAPEACDIYVVSANKITSNSLNPMLTSGMSVFRCLNHLTVICNLNWFYFALYQRGRVILMYLVKNNLAFLLHLPSPNTIAASQMLVIHIIRGKHQGALLCVLLLFRKQLLEPQKIVSQICREIKDFLPFLRHTQIR